MKLNKPTLFTIKSISIFTLFVGISLCSNAQSTAIRESRPVNVMGELTSADWSIRVNYETMLQGLTNPQSKLKAVHYQEFDIRNISNRLTTVEQALNTTVITSDQRIEFEEFKTTLLMRKLALLEEVRDLDLETDTLTFEEILDEISNVKTALK